MTRVSPAPAPGPAAARHPAPWWAALLVVWVLTRAWVLEHAVGTLTRATLFNDINLVWAWAHRQPFGDDPSPVLTEYPGLARLLASSALLTDDPNSFGWAWIAVMLLVDLVLVLLLARAGTRPAWLWVIAGAALGPVVWLRYDLLVAVLAVAAVQLRTRRAAWSGVLLGLAVLLKLWPLLLAAALLPGERWRRWGLTAGGTVVGGVALEALLLGRASVLAPFVYQSGRGLQIESLPATPSLWAGRDEDPTTVWEFEFRAFQLQDSAGSGWDLLGLAVTAAVGLAVLVLVYRAAAAPDPRGPRLDALRASSAALLATTLVAVNTVFSPQYVLWLLPLAALAAAGPGVPRAVDVVLVALAGLTQLIWPWYYESLLNLFPETLAVLALRNGLVLVLVLLLAVVVARQARASHPEPAPVPAQPATNESRT
jgi:hypothetical protein